MGLKWISSKCPRSKFVCKSDDDMFVKIHQVFHTLLQPSTPHQKLLLCRVTTNSPVLREGKYQVPINLYNETIWPSFCFGGFWIATTDVIKKFYEESLLIPQLYLDDVFLTGIIRERIGLKQKRVSRVSMLFCHGKGDPEKVLEMWKTRNLKDGSIMINNTKINFLQCG